MHAIDPKLAFLAGLGAAIGAVARVCIFDLSTSVSTSAILLGVNAFGCFCMGLLHVRREALQVFFGTGILGGFTSFSAFAALLADLPLPLAFGQMFATLTMCVAAWATGDALAHKRSHTHNPPSGEQS